MNDIRNRNSTKPIFESDLSVAKIAKKANAPLDYSSKMITNFSSTCSNSFASTFFAEVYCTMISWACDEILASTSSDGEEQDVWRIYTAEMSNSHIWSNQAHSMSYDDVQDFEICCVFTWGSEISNSLRLFDGILNIATQVEVSVFFVLYNKCFSHVSGRFVSLSVPSWKGKKNESLAVVALITMLRPQDVLLLKVSGCGSCCEAGSVTAGACKHLPCMAAAVL